MQSIVPSVTRDLSSRNEILRFAQDDLLSQVRFLPEPGLSLILRFLASLGMTEAKGSK